MVDRMASEEDCRAYQAKSFRLHAERNLPLPYYDAGIDEKLGKEYASRGFFLNVFFLCCC